MFTNLKTFIEFLAEGELKVIFDDELGGIWHIL